MTALALWLYSLRPLWAGRRAEPTPLFPKLPPVSIIVPARNEAHNLPALLGSLKGASAEIIVVDDHSTDGTAQIARSFGAKVVEPPPLPEGWLGKPWAAHNGALAASGAVLVFTDADTVHGSALLELSARALAAGTGLVSVVPTHIIAAPWEKLQGPFQCLLLIASTLVATTPKRGFGKERRFCIGQYLAFRRDVYEAIGGHRAVANRVAEDLAFARLVADHDHRYELLVQRGALRVRMYPEGLGSFIAGWRRNFREGLRSAGPRGFISVAFVIGWLLGAPLWVLFGIARGDLALVAGGIVSYGAAVLAVRRAQLELGDFPSSSALAYPLFVVLFSIVSVLATWDRLRGAPIRWRGRSVTLPK